MAFEGLGTPSTLEQAGLKPVNASTRPSVPSPRVGTPPMAAPSLVTLHPIPSADLPSRNNHPSAFLRAILIEATSLLPGTPTAAEPSAADAVTIRTPTYAVGPLLWSQRKPHTGDNSHGHKFVIESYSASRVCKTAGASEAEYWFARRSVHPAEHASYDEFTRGLLHRHAENEIEYIGTVKGVNVVFEYPAKDGITAAVYEVLHRLPAPLKPRVFPILLVTQETEGGFYVVSVPVTGLEGANERHKKTVQARYVSVERVRKLDNGETEWCMSTASDAGGALPMVLQKPAIPGTIAKDVGWFLGWVRAGMVRKHL